VGARRAAQLDRINLGLAGNDDLADAVRTHEDYVKGETLATTLELNGAADGGTIEIEGMELRISIERAT